MTKTLEEKMKIDTSFEELEEVRKKVGSLCEEISLEEKTSELLILAVDEALTSIVKHARDMNKEGNVIIEFDINEVRFRAYIEDQTKVCSSTELGLSREEKIKEYDEHRMGIYLMQTIMDEINYTFRKGFQNDLELIHFLD